MTKQKTITQPLELLTVSDVANKEKMSTQRIYQLIGSGEISEIYRFGSKKKKILIGKSYKIKIKDKKNKS